MQVKINKGCIFTKFSQHYYGVRLGGMVFLKPEKAGPNQARLPEWETPEKKTTENHFSPSAPLGDQVPQESPHGREAAPLAFAWERAGLSWSTRTSSPDLKHRTLPTFSSEE